MARTGLELSVNPRNLKPLALALAVGVALAACQKTEAPADTAAAPVAAAPVVERVRWADLSDDEDNSAELYQTGDIIVVIRGFEDGTAEIVAMRGEQTIGDLNEHIERKRGLQRSQFVLKHGDEYLKRSQTIESLGLPACVLHVVPRRDSSGAPRGYPVASNKAKWGRLR